MQKLPTLLSLFLKMLCFAVGVAAYCEIGVDHFSSSDMQQAFEEGMAWAKGGMKQGVFEKESIHPSEKIPDDKSSLIDTEEGFFKCFKSNNSHLETPSLSESLYIFISFSVPEESLKELSYGLEKTGGFFVIRGLPQNSFREFFEKTKSLKEKGILAPILVDPEAFEKFNIERVPTFALKNGESFEKYEGNIPLRDALRIFSERERVGLLAKELLQKLIQPCKQGGFNQEDLYDHLKIPREESLL
jgi:conjugal transfer pilus assembly protein TrbC